MERRMTKYSQVSPGRAKVWTEKSAKYVQNRKVPVVYYLCRNRQLDHPHFIEVSLSSPDGLYLRDVIEKLNLLRGRGMASTYSWSCKRSYKNGFVWNDLCEDDLILPAQGNEYVLKGSEIIAESNSGHLSPVATHRIQNVRQLPEPPSSRSQGETSSSSGMHAKETKHHQDEEISPSSQCSGCSGASLDSRMGNSSPWAGSLSLTEYKAPKNDRAADASTQTEETARSTKVRETCTRGVSTDDGLVDGESNVNCHNHDQHVKQHPHICRNSPSPLSSPSASSSGGKPDTLESLIRTDASKINSFRILEEEDVRIPSNRKLKASDVLMQLISCGSISVKDHSFGLVPTYRPEFSHMKFPSPVYSNYSMLGELDYLPENPRLMGGRREDKEYFSGSLIETKILKEGGSHTTLKRASSFNANRYSEQHELNNDEVPTSARSRCLPLSIRSPGCKQPRSESMRSPLSDKPRSSSSNLDGSYVMTHDASHGDSQRLTEPSPEGKVSNNSFRKDREKIIKACFRSSDYNPIQRELTIIIR
ncbi:hypothetical protein V2J09_005938 [Rumex salicifolius]